MTLAGVDPVQTVVRRPPAPVPGHRLGAMIRVADAREGHHSEAAARGETERVGEVVHSSQNRTGPDTSIPTDPFARLRRDRDGRFGLACPWCPLQRLPTVFEDGCELTGPATRGKGVAGKARPRVTTPVRST